MSSTIDPSWMPHLATEFETSYWQELMAFLDAEQKAGKIVYPPKNEVFNAFKQTPFDKVKVVILGQDPYHGPDQAHGLAFSVRKGVTPPPSLVNIFKELQGDLGLAKPAHGNLEAWAQEGVLLLNTVLTVEKGKAGSHHKRGWETFTDKVIEVLNAKKESLVFILWGSPAHRKASLLDANKHFIIKSVHPSPLSSYRGFFGSKPFSLTNHYLKSRGIKEIDWKLESSPVEVAETLSNS